MKLFGGFLGRHTRDENVGKEPVMVDTVQLMQEIKNRKPDENREEFITEKETMQKKNDNQQNTANETTERKRTPEELAEIEAIIAAYQKKKKKRRLIALCILVVLALGGVIAWKSIVKPPDIVTPTSKPSATPIPEQPQDNNPEQEDTQQPVDKQETDDEPELKARERLEGVYTFLLLGREQSYGNTDTIMVGVMNVNAGTVNIISIPRDICMNVDCDPDLTETKKVNSIFARGGIEGLEAALSDLMGFPIDSYVSVGINGFINLVNTIGGVYFDVPYNMNYDDPTQDLHIHFSKGNQYLNGYDAIKVVRWRQNNDGSNYGDLARIQTQQNFLKTVIKQCLSWTNLANNLDDYIEIFNEYVKTDLTTGNMAWYAKQVLKMSMDNINFYTLPCEPSVNIRGFSYGVVKADEWLTLLNESFNIYDQPITMDDLDLIVLDENGDISATSGTIRGGYDSFLSYQDYIKRLNAWNEQQAKKNETNSTASEAVETNTEVETGSEPENETDTGDIQTDEQNPSASSEAAESEDVPSPSEQTDNTEPQTDSNESASSEETPMEPNEGE